MTTTQTTTNGGATLDTLPGVPMAERPRPSYLPASCDLGRAS